MFYRSRRGSVRQRSSCGNSAVTTCRWSTGVGSQSDCWMNAICSLKACSRRAGCLVLVAFAVLAITGCKRRSKRLLPQVSATGETTQVLKHFTMQEILNGAKNMTVESIEGRLSEKTQTADVDKPRV